MKLRFYEGLAGVGLALVAACGGAAASKDSGSAGAGGAGLALDVPEPAMAGAAGSKKAAPAEAGSAGDGGSGGETGAAGAATPREDLKPVLLYVASSDSGKALYSWDMSDAEPVNVSGSLKSGYAVDEFAVSPDGMRVAFINRRLKEDAGEVYVADADGALPKRLSGAAVPHIWPSHVSWSKGGRYVMYDTDDFGNPQSSIVQHVFEVETGRPVAIHGLISPDEKRVVVFEQGAITVQATDGSNRIELTQSKDEPTLSWSADGQMLSMWAKGGRQSVLSADGKSVWRFNDCDEPPVWAPQGQWLAFSRDGQFFIQAPRADELAINPPDTKVVDWHWAPDGAQVAVSAGDLNVYPIETGQPIRVNGPLPSGTTGVRPGVGLFSWSSDGQYIAYNTVGFTRDEFLIAHPDGFQNSVVSHNVTGTVSSIEWSPGSAYVAYREADGDRFWYVASMLGENTFVSDGANGAWSDDGQFFAVEAGDESPSIRVLRLSDKEIIGPDGPADAQNLTFGWAHK